MYQNDIIESMVGSEEKANCMYHPCKYSRSDAYFNYLEGVETRVNVISFVTKEMIYYYYNNHFSNKHNLIIIDSEHHSITHKRKKKVLLRILKDESRSFIILTTMANICFVTHFLDENGIDVGCVISDEGRYRSTKQVKHCSKYETLGKYFRFSDNKKK